MAGTPEQADLHGAGGAANVLTDRAGAFRNIRTAIDAAIAAAGLGKDALHRSGVLLGLAGSNVGDTGAFIAASLPAGRVAVVSDGLIALEGGHTQTIDGHPKLTDGEKPVTGKLTAAGMKYGLA